jgi:hypothetical protein
MRISGGWYLCNDGEVRPVVQGEVEVGDGSWLQAPFLVDTGADCTVFSVNVFRALRLPSTPHDEALGGVGGVAASVTLETRIQLFREDGSAVVFRGRYAALTAPEALDMSVLGRDITQLFALIVDRPGDVVCLLRPPHRYTIEQT